MRVICKAVLQDGVIKIEDVERGIIHTEAKADVRVKIKCAFAENLYKRWCVAVVESACLRNTRFHVLAREEFVLIYLCFHTQCTRPCGNL